MTQGIGAQLRSTTKSSTGPTRVMLTIAGHDPLGGAGIIADTTVFRDHGFGGLSIITSQTVQSGTGVHQVLPSQPGFMGTVLEKLLSSIEPVGIKIGLIPQSSQVLEIAECISWLDCPVVLDPVLAASGGQSLVEESVTDAILDHLLRQITTLTPNVDEVCRLGHHKDPIFAARILMTLNPNLMGVIVTGVPYEQASSGVADVAVTKEAIYMLPLDAPPRTREIHGTGCHYSSAAACALAKGGDLMEAAGHAQNYVRKRIAAGVIPLKGSMDML